jgi:dihydrodipicolinate synthase/N-acetylneuraminate lyase
MDSRGRLKGIFTPNIVPLDRHGEIAEGELRRYVDWLIDSRRAWALPQRVSTGEFTRFTRG